MMDWNEIVDKLKSREVPSGAMAGAGILALLFAVKTGKGIFKIILVLAALALLAGAVWWYVYKR
jgi:LPXTG-motif cell wall-anchored protein